MPKMTKQALKNNAVMLELPKYREEIQTVLPLCVEQVRQLWLKRYTLKIVWDVHWRSHEVKSHV